MRKSAVVDPRPLPPEPRTAGRASARARAATASARSRRRIHSRKRKRRISASRTSRRNSTEENSTRLGRRRVSRWMSTGTAEAASPKRKKGLRKVTAGSEEPAALLEIAKQRHVVGRIGGELHVIHVLLAALSLVALGPG